MDKKEFTEEIVSKIASFFADKYQSPQLSFQLVNCGTCGSAPCDCSCAGPSDSDH